MKIRIEVKREIYENVDGDFMAAKCIKRDKIC